MTITLDEYRALMETRTRPLGDPYMDNWRATKARNDAAVTYESIIPNAISKRAPLELIPELQPDRRPHENTRQVCGTDQGYHAHRRFNKGQPVTCPECLAAHHEATRQAKAIARGNR